MREEEAMVTMFALMIFAGVAVLWMAMQSRRRFREMEHRERLAMIERGLVPSPEANPAAFERSLPAAARVNAPVGIRMRSAGVILIGFGLALAVLIAITGEAPRVGLGIGGAFVMIGLAFLVNATVVSQQETSYSAPRSATGEPVRRDLYPPSSSSSPPSSSRSDGAP